MVEFAEVDKLIIDGCEILKVTATVAFEASATITVYAPAQSPLTLGVFAPKGVQV
jgi:hypothetical protein